MKEYKLDNVKKNICMIRPDKRLVLAPVQVKSRHWPGPELDICIFLIYKYINFINYSFNYFYKILNIQIKSLIQAQKICLFVLYITSSLLVP